MINDIKAINIPQRNQNQIHILNLSFIIPHIYPNKEKKSKRIIRTQK